MGKKRIAFQDNWLCLFTRVLQNHWDKKGYWVTWEPGYNPELLETCDIVFFESADTNSHLASAERPAKKGKAVLRIIDIDAWANGPAGIRGGYFDDIIYITEHIQEYCREKYKHLKPKREHLIKMGIDLDKYTFREKPRGRKIAFVATRLTEEKGFDIALQILAEVRKKSNQWELHVVGRMPDDDLWKKTIEHIIRTNELEDSVTFYENLPYDTGTEINDFLEDKDYLLLPSRKEAFSFAVGEAMAKGIKPVIWNWLGAEDTWPADVIFNTPSEAVESLLSNVYNPKHYRQWVEDKYPLDKHLEAMDKALEL